MLTTRAFVGILAGIAMLAGLIGLLTEVTTTGSTTSYLTGSTSSSTMSCGSVFDPSTPDAYAATVDANCQTALDQRQAWAWPALGLGVIAAVGAWMTSERRKSSGSVDTVGEAG